MSCLTVLSSGVSALLSPRLIEMEPPSPRLLSDGDGGSGTVVATPGSALAVASPELYMLPTSSLPAPFTASLCSSIMLFCRAWRRLPVLGEENNRGREEPFAAPAAVKCECGEIVALTLLRDSSPKAAYRL